MKTVLAVAVAILMVAFSVYARDGFSVIYNPDARVPYLALEGVHSLPVSFGRVGATWELGTFTFIEHPPWPDLTFYVINVTPWLEIKGPSAWELTASCLLQYRTNLADRMVIQPEVRLWHPW